MYCYNCEQDRKVIFVKSKDYFKIYCAHCDFLLSNSVNRKVRRKIMHPLQKNSNLTNSFWVFFVVILMFAAAYLGGK